ncbi:Golgi reassembly-stacking protein 2 [Cricetulus griseus]|uniref:Golgi reassembly-stacking protein 2 n=1 Tax=Cricetulus griseus TaxID=10029 RepID=G3GUA5_CRIGR|nr:Golgi reassembly-stacking protein 2 [Cricetulus griseus]
MPNLPNLPNLPNFNLPAPHIMPGVGLPELGNPEGSSAASAGEPLSSLPATGPPSDPVMTTAKAEAASSLTVDMMSPASKVPSTVEDRVGDSTATTEKPVSAVTDANASESS